MAACSAYKDSTKERCGAPTELGFKFCEEHKSRRGAVKERLEHSVKALGNPQNTPNNPQSSTDHPGSTRTESDEAFDKETEQEREIQVATQPSKEVVVNNTSHRTIVDQVNAMLVRVVDFEFQAYNEAQKLDPSEWRYRDKAGAEQVRGEVQIYERAMDRSLRALTTITKLGIEQQAVIIEKAQYEGVRTAMHRTLVRLGFNDKEISQALAILAEEFSKLIPQD